MDARGAPVGVEQQRGHLHHVGHELHVGLAAAALRRRARRRGERLPTGDGELCGDRFSREGRGRATPLPSPLCVYVRRATEMRANLKREEAA
eukprot:5902224-Pleurochrysis_carterae.AAC.1